MIHELKITPEYFEAIAIGKKTFEVRANDRDYKVGDYLALNEYDASGGSYTGRSCMVYVDYILKDENYCKSGYVIMGIKPCKLDLLCCKFSVPLVYESEEES